VLDPGTRLRPLAALALLSVAVAACSGGGATPSPSVAAGPATIAVQLQEWAVTPAATSVKAGKVTFQVKNTGPKDTHEFVVLQTDLDAAALPTDADGVVNEEATGIKVVDEIEDLEVGKTQELAVTLAPGKYVFLCNVYDAKDKEAHYKLGMRTAFTVTP